MKTLNVQLIIYFYIGIAAFGHHYDTLSCIHTAAVVNLVLARRIAMSLLWGYYFTNDCNCQPLNLLPVCLPLFH